MIGRQLLNCWLFVAQSKANGLPFLYEVMAWTACVKHAWQYTVIHHKNFIITMSARRSRTWLWSWQGVRQGKVVSAMPANIHWMDKFYTYKNTKRLTLQMQSWDCCLRYHLAGSGYLHCSIAHTHICACPHDRPHAQTSVGVAALHKCISFIRHIHVHVQPSIYRYK